MSCPCGLEASYDNCCGAYISGAKPVPTAESLMRSRYTAYVEHEIEWIFATHDPATRETTREEIKAWANKTQWKKLTVIETQDGLEDDDVGIVAFEAQFLDDGIHFHRERSTFRRHEGAWVYVSGTPIQDGNQPRSVAKVGRNEPCPCGSGRKFKKCCA